jgi:hypothetical protein
VALRVKCKCGKLMKIPSAQAGKNLSCPGCKKVFRISPEKFKQAGEAPRSAAGRSPPPVSPKPVAAAPTPMPEELDILPVDLDVPAGSSLSQSDILGDAIPNAKPAAASPSGKLGLTCPLCRKTLLPGAVLCVDCGFNAATGTYVQASLPPLAQPVTTAPTAGYAADGSRITQGSSRLDRDAIHGPTRDFWTDAISAFGYPFMSAGNAITLGIVAFIYCLELALGYAGCLGLLGVFCIQGWIAAMYLSVVQDTASGSPDLPGIKMEGGVVEDIIKPFFRYLGAFACACFPAAAYVLLMSTGALPSSLESGLNLMLVMAVGIFLWPVFVMLFAFNALDMIYRADLIFTTVIRTFLPYLALWVMLLLVGFVKFLPLAALLVAQTGLSITVPQVPQLGGLAGKVSFNIIDLYLGVVSMRLIGLYYLHFKKRFTLIME